MQTENRQSSSFAKDKVRLALVAGIVASLIGSVWIYSYETSQIDKLESELATKSNTIDLQSQQIQQHAGTISAQEQEIGAKIAELQDLNGQIETLSFEIITKEEEITAQEQEIDSLDATVSIQRQELDQLLTRAAELESEIEALQAEIAASQGKISDLNEQVQDAQEQLDAVKRVEVSHYGLAVDQDENGIVFPIYVEIIGSGEGTISVDVSNVQYQASFQRAVRTAANVASDYTGVSVSDKDIIVRFINDRTDGVLTVDGPSAGALITAMIIAGLSEKELDSSVLITGTINSDGSVGSIGALPSKTEAAVEFGASTILVPESQQFNDSRIEVVGVSDISEVVDHLFKP